MHLLIRSDKTFLRSYAIKLPLISSYTVKIHLISSHTIKIPSYQILHDKDSVLSDFIRQKILKYGMFFTLKIIRSCSHAVAEKLQHATLKCQSNKEKNILYCLLRLIRYRKKDYLSDRGFLRSADYQTRLKIFLQRPKLSWTAKFRHSTPLQLTIKLPPKQNQQTFFVSKLVS